MYVNSVKQASKKAMYQLYKIDIQHYYLINLTILGNVLLTITFNNFTYASYCNIHIIGIKIDLIRA